MTPAPPSSPVRLLDCTLRDGGYAIHFQFSSRDTRNVVQGLERAGLGWIEVGHGLGLGASSPAHGLAFESDEEYIHSAKSVAGQARIGSFFIPGIGRAENLNRAREAGLDFVRVGIEVGHAGECRALVEHARALGLSVHLNLMKTYALSPEELAPVIRTCRDWPLEVVYVVDSAGCLLPWQVEAYVRLLGEETGHVVGFHGHNNLSLANANCLAAIQAGARFVDSSLLGMGRSAGNAQTEVLAHLLAVSGIQTGIDPFALFQVSQRCVAPLLPKPQGLAPLDVVIGMSRFHSGFLPRFKKVLDKYDVDLYRLIAEVSRVDCVHPSDELIESLALDLSRTEGTMTS